MFTDHKFSCELRYCRNVVHYNSSNSLHQKPPKYRHFFYENRKKTMFLNETGNDTERQTGRPTVSETISNIYLTTTYTFPMQ